MLLLRLSQCQVRSWSVSDAAWLAKYANICVQDRAIGGIGFRLHSDVERTSAEVGYWLGEPVLGKGIVAEALRAVTRLVIERHGLKRVFAVPCASDPASFRVLEKHLLE